MKVFTAGAIAALLCGWCIFSSSFQPVQGYISNHRPLVRSQFFTAVTSWNVKKSPRVMTRAAMSPSRSRSLTPRTVIEEYFKRWNERDMSAAIELFAEDCQYEDTLYSGVFQGKEKIKAHLLNVAKSLPDSFAFVIDGIAEDVKARSVGVQWHVESEGQVLPFTRGSSFYTFNSAGLIEKGFDVPEPVVKAGSANLAILRFAKNLISEPIRAVPIAAWIFYCWFLFLSDVAPGVNALQLDPNTWQEVKDLSINFWLILPIVAKDIAPVFHPIMEGLFNLVLAWSALFFGFAIDGFQKSSRGTSSIIKPLIGMQFLTNAIYLPYLFNRDSKGKEVINSEELTVVEKFGESKVLPILLGAVGAVAVIWGALARPEYGNLAERVSSFIELASSDRLTFAFVMDAIYYGLFQGWLIDDDLKRRQEAENTEVIRRIGKTVPFVGLVIYLLARPPLKLEKQQ